MFQCCNCNFSVVSTYLSHIKSVHGHDRNFLHTCKFNGCPVLCKNFHAFKKHLFQHKELCTKPIMFNCKFCGFHSCHKRKFISHFKSHSVIECPVSGCNRAFTNFSSFTSHLSRYHPTFLADFNSVDRLQTESPDEFFEIGSMNTFDVLNVQENKNALLQHKITMFILKLQEQFLLPMSTITEIVNGMKDIQECQFDLINSKIIQLLEKNHINQPTDVQINDMDPILDSIKSSHLRKKLMINYGIVPPVEYKLGNGKTFQYISIIDNLKMFCCNADILKYISMPHKNKNSVLRDIQDGSLFNQNDLFQQYPNIQILLYLDDFLVTNPLRGNQAQHKTTALYYTLANLPPIYRSTVCDMQLAIICKSADLKKFGFRLVLAPLLKDLKILEDDGITINGIAEKVKGTIVSIVGDNLASHEIGGYCTNFSSRETCICRFCMATYDDMMNNFKERDFTRRTKQIHEHHINLVTLDDSYIKLYGLKWNSPLNDLKFFHTSTMLPPDAMHDLLEGIVPFELSLIISNLIKSKFISLPLLNRRIRNMKFGYNDKPNKPYELTENFSKGIKMTASRLWSLLRFLPLMIGDFVPENEIVWEFLLILKDIVDIVLSPVISIDYISYLSDLLNEHHNLFKEIFKDAKLKPKHHFLVHYPKLILEFGPLVHLWCMRFEAKHLYFKRVAQISKNTKNLPLTLAQRHQQLQCIYNSKQERILGKGVVVTNAKPIDKNLYSAEINTILESHGDFFVTQKVLILGTAYKPGMCIVVNFKNDEPVFGKIVLILCKGPKILFVCNIYNSCTVFHIRGYKLEKCDEIKILSPEEMLYHYPLSVYKYRNNSVVIPKYLLFDHVNNF